MAKKSPGTKPRTTIGKKSSPRNQSAAVDGQRARSQSHRSQIQLLARRAVRFRDERDWKQFHNPKDMALSMCLEAAEVLELMQWKNGRELVEHLRSRREDLADELSDVLYWVLTIAHDFDIELSAAFRRKLRKSAKKYPIEKSRGRSCKYTEL